MVVGSTSLVGRALMSPLAFLTRCRNLVYGWRILAISLANPRGFLEQAPGGTLAIDDVQRVPALALKAATKR